MTTTRHRHIHLGTYYGSDLTPEEAEVRALKFIERKTLRLERKIRGTTWFDYRGMNSAEATYYFAHCYTKAVQHIMAKRDDFNRAQYLRGWKGSDDIFEKQCTNLSGMWKARQNADRYGIPYRFYISTIMTNSDAQLWHHLPRPQQLYNKATTEMVVAAWEEELRQTIMLPEHPDYRLDHYRGEKCQNDFHAWLCDRIMAKRHPEIDLATFLIHRPYLTEEIAAKLMGDEWVTRALNF